MKIRTDRDAAPARKEPDRGPEPDAEELRRRITARALAISTWLDATLRLAARSVFVRDRIRSVYAGDLAEAWQAVTGNAVTVQVDAERGLAA